MTTTHATQAELTAEQKDAYNKGWASKAKSQMIALNGYAKKVEDAELHRLFAMGWADAAAGSPKWDSLLNARLEATRERAKAVRFEDAEGRVEAVLRVEDEAPAEAPEEATRDFSTSEKRGEWLRSFPKAEAPEEAPAPEVGKPQKRGAGARNQKAAAAATAAPAAPAAEGEPTIAALRRSVTKEMSRDEVRAIRGRVVVKKRHYKLGYDAFGADSSTLAEAQERYIKRHGGPDAARFVGDWTQGWTDAAAGLAKGASY